MTGERARLFVALELPPEVRAALVAWRTSSVDADENVRFVAADDLHVTLCFLGWRDGGEVQAIAEACRTVGGRGALELRLGDPVALPRRRPRVLAIALEDLRGGLAALQDALASALEAGGFYEREPRPFFGHVTVARAGRGGRIPRGALAVPLPAAEPFGGDSVVLYRSHLRRAGASYEAVARVGLEPA